MPADLSDRYSRQTMLIGEEGQLRLSQASVLIVGLGGLGAPVATYLAGAGTGHLGLADPDTVSLSNLHRQTLYSETQTGMPKTEAAAERLRAIYAGIRLSLYPEGLTPLNARRTVGLYDLVIDCTDNFAARYLIEDAAVAGGKPWVYGAIGEYSGQVSVFNHLKGRRYSELYPDREELCALPRTTSGVLGPLPGVIGAMQASEAIKIITGIGETAEGKLLSIDLLTLRTETITF